MSSYYLTVVHGLLPEGYSFILNLDKDLLIEIGFQLFNTIFLCLFLGYILYKPVKNFLQARKDRIAGDLKSSREAKQEAETVLKEYKTKLAEIAEERTAILEKAREEAAANRAIIIEEANKEATELKERAKLQIERDREEAQDEIRLQIIQVSTLIASRFVKESLNESAQNKIVEDVIKDLGDVKWQS
ncbi:MAG: F0F1 ATP synthase subunit B [Clostridiales bacterium]|nr:F0F1 ATP synthase subunit B [Clostridiales bacterium]